LAIIIIGSILITNLLETNEKTDQAAKMGDEFTGALK
jgi:uncharacterized protein YejL (UPF0352 family)